MESRKAWGELSLKCTAKGISSSCNGQANIAVNVISFPLAKSWKLNFCLLQNSSVSAIYQAVEVHRDSGNSNRLSPLVDLDMPFILYLPGKYFMFIPP